MTLVPVQLWEMGWGRRIVLLILIAVGAMLLGIALSAAWARPAAAATLPVPNPSGLTAAVPAPVTSALSAVGDVTNGSGVVGSATGLPSSLISGVTGATGG